MLLLSSRSPPLDSTSTSLQLRSGSSTGARSCRPSTNFFFSPSIASTFTSSLSRSGSCEPAPSYIASFFHDHAAFSRCSRSSRALRCFSMRCSTSRLALLSRL